MAWVNEKRSHNAKVNLPFHGYYAYFCTYSQMPIGTETYHFQANPVASKQVRIG